MADDKGQGVRTAIITDIHGNREALESVLADMEQRAVDRVVCLGDIVGYGPDPGWCVDRMMALAQAGAVIVKGNHDEAVANPSAAMNITARRAIDWTRPLLSDAQKGFLAGLPLTHRAGDVLYVHASANSPQDWIYVTDTSRAAGSFSVSDARVILVGHRHVPDLMSRSIDGRITQQRHVVGRPMPLLRTRRWLAVIGAVGQPRDGVAKAGYAILDEAANELSFLRVGYDVAKTVAKLRAAGLPESLAVRLTWGA